ncbi:MAG TPA: ABC transporter permease [Bryobacteraceae bacterium]|nr:ABC transporter permease [Bryobacteraceae bacterium]
MPAFTKDLWFGLRLLHRSPWFTALVVLTLGLGIAVNTTVFSWIDSVLLRPFPGVGDPQELALIETVTPTGEYLVNTSYLDYRDYAANLKLVSGISLARFTPLSVGPEGRTSRAWAELVSPNYFDVLKVKPLLGRTFRPEEGAQEGSSPVAVISYGTWQSRYHGDPKILGKTIRLNRHDLTIIGVAPPAFRGTLAGVVFDVWAPVTMATAMGTGNGTLHYRGTRDQPATVVRLKPGVTIEQARAEVAALGKRLAAMYPATNRGIDLTVTPLWRGHLGAQGILLQPLRILMALSLLLLVIVCANVANLLLARAVSRQREFGIRLAMGAPRSRLVTQLLIETLLLACGGAIVGIILVLWMGQSLGYLLRFLDVPLDLGGSLNLPTLLFTVLVTFLATLLSGAVPALLSSRAELNETLKEGGRTGGSGSGSHRLRGLLVVAEMALVMVTLVGAGLFYRSFRNASGIQPGFDRTNISVSQFYLSYAGYSAREQHDFCRMLRERMESKPGVLGVSYSDVVPMSTSSGAGLTPWHLLSIEGYSPAANERMMIHRATVAPGYFQLLGIRLLEGREFTERDSAEAPMVVIVNETFARRFFHGASPIGRKIFCDRHPATVVGLARDSKYHTPIEGPTPFFYLPFRQWFAPGLNFAIFLKTAGDPMRMTSVLRQEALALNQDAVFTTCLLSDANIRSLVAQQVAASVLAVVAGIALLLAAVGLYSVMSYAVSQRTQEIGIRMALGAQPGDVLGLVLRQGIRLTIPGLLAGGAVALAGTRIVGGFLVNVGPFDPLTFLGAAAFLSVIAALASYLPALRALHVDPVVALRNE